jgi:hypothetical protein
MPVKAATLFPGARFMHPELRRVVKVTWVDQSNEFWTQVGFDGGQTSFLNEEIVVKVVG